MSWPQQWHVSNWHFPRAPRAFKLLGAFVMLIVSIVVLTGLKSAVENIRGGIDVAGYVPPRWFTANVIGPFWWVPALACFVLLVWGCWPSRKPVPAPVANPKTLRDYYDESFSGLGCIFGTISLAVSDGSKGEYPAKIVYDFEKNTKVVVMFVDVMGIPALKYLPSLLNANITRMEKSYMTVSYPSDQISINSNEIPFSGRLVIYHEGVLSHADIAAMENDFKRHGATPIFRGHAYLWSKRLGGE